MNRCIKYLLYYIMSCSYLILYIYFGTERELKSLNYCSNLKENYIFQIIIIYAFFYFSIYFLQKKIKNNNFKFYSIALFSVITMAYLSYFTRGELLKWILFNDPHDTFMDYFNCLFLGDTPYSAQPIEGYPKIAVYPPLSMVFFNILGHISAPDSIQPWHKTAIDIRSSQVGMTVFGLYSTILYTSIVYLWTCIKQGNACEKISFVFSMLLSIPFIFMFERGNNILLSLFFLTCFVFFNDYPNRKVQLTSFMCLAIATSIKISPVIFSLVLLRNKRYKDFVLSMFFTVVIFFLPFIFLDDVFIEQFFQFVEIIRDNSFFYSNAVFPIIFIDSKKLLSIFIPEFISTIIKWFIILCGIWEVLFFKALTKWEVITILSSLVILIPPFSAIYSLVYMSIPLILYLDRDKDIFKTNDNIFLYFFLGIFILIPNFPNTYRISTFLECISILEIVLLIELRAIVKAFKTNNNNN